MAIRIIHPPTFTMLDPNECMLIDDEDPETRSLLEQIGDRLVGLSAFGAQLRADILNVDLSYEDDGEENLPNG